MKQSLLKDIIHYAKTTGRAPLDERQMNTLKDLYVELAKSAILGAMVFIILYGYMDSRGMETTFDFISLTTSYLGVLTYYYFIRICYYQVIGIDVNFEILVVPAFLFTPSLVMNTLHLIGMWLNVGNPFYTITALLWPLYMFLFYLGANRVYQNGKLVQEQQLANSEVHFRSRKQIVNFIITAIILLALLPISYDFIFKIGIIVSTLFVFYLIIYYGYCNTSHNDYILNESGLIYYKALWNHKGGYIAYEDIDYVDQRDTFNVGYAKDKVCIHCKNGETIMLFPENAYQFCVELENNI